MEQTVLKSTLGGASIPYSDESFTVLNGFGSEADAKWWEVVLQVL